jgi:hypothetical protein
LMCTYLYSCNYEWDRHNFPMGITIEYSTTGQAGGYRMDGAPESARQPT